MCVFVFNLNITVDGLHKHIHPLLLFDSNQDLGLRDMVVMISTELQLLASVQGIGRHGIHHHPKDFSMLCRSSQQASIYS